MQTYRTENGNEYRVKIENAWNKIYFVDRARGGYKLEFVSSVPRGVHGDNQIDAKANDDAHAQIVERIERHAESRVA